MKVGDVSMRLMLDVQQAVKAAGDFEHSFDGIGDAGRKAAAQLTAQLQKMAADIEKLSKQGGGLGSGIGEGLEKVAKKGQVSASQTAAAWSQLPMQLQDIAVSLQGGMSPATVLMQQVPQITGSFGGLKATVAAFGAAIPPAAAAAAVLAVGLGAVGIAAYQGAQETRAFEAALIGTGGRVGVTADGLSTMARRMDGLAGVTRGQASAALAVMATQSGITADNIERITGAALRMANAGGPAVAETAARFGELAKDPLSASLKLNEATGFLTESVYRQIRALDARGQADAAAKVAMDAYAATMAERAAQMEANMGSLERLMKTVTTTAREAWDALLGIGREDTLDQQISKAAQKVAEAQAMVSKGGRKGWFGETLDTGEGDLMAAQSELFGLQQRKAADAAAAKAKADAAKRVQDQIQEDGAAGDLRRAIAAAQIAADLAQAKAGADARIRAEDDKAAALAAVRAQGLVSEQEAARQSLAIEQAKLTAKLRLIDQEIAAEKRRPLKADDVQGQLAKQAKLTEMQSQRAGVANQLRTAPITTDWKIQAADLTEARASMTAWAQSWQQASDRVTALADQTAQAQAAMIEAPIAAAAAQADLTVARLERDAARAKVAYESMIATLRAQGQTGAADALQTKVNGIDNGVAAQAAAERQKVAMDYLKDSTAGLASGWDRVTQAIGGSVQAMLALATEEKNYEAALKAAGKDQGQIAQVQARHAQAQMRSYAAMADAAKGYFKEGSKGYKAMDAASKAFRAAEMAMAIKSALQKIGLIEGETAAKISGDAVAVASSQAAATAETAAAMQAGAANATAAVANQGAKGDPYTAWARMAMMAAAMAAIGFAVRGGGGGGGGASLASTRQAETGTGTVLGDPTAKSKSIENALGLLKDVDTMTMKYSAGMLASLRNIEASMAGVTTQILRTGKGITTGTNMGIQTGLIARNQGDPLLQGSGIPGLKLLDNMTRSAPIIGPILNRLTGLWGKTTQEIIDAGIALNGTAADLAAGRGAAQYATVETRRSSWFGLSKSSSTEEVRQALDAGITAQFAKIFSGVGDSLVAASRAFGQPVDTIRQQLAGYVIDIQHLSLKGLSAEDMKTAIAAAVGAQADRMAQSVRPGLEAFQRVGEGYYETVIRTASASEQAGQALSKLGLGVVSLSAVANKQAEDLGAEMVRAAILAAERGGSSITAITNSIEGTASDLVDAYSSLLDVRTGMQQMGFGATDASFDLLSGAGGLDALTSGMQAFRERFATQEQSIGLLTAKMTQQFERLGVSLPANADGFATLVHAIDTTTEAGRRELGGLLALAPAYAQFLDDTGQAAEKLKTASEIAQERAGLERKLFELHGDTATLRELELQQLDKSNWPLQRRIWALQDEREKLAQLASAGKGIGSVVDELMGATAASAGTSKALAQANYDRDLAAARAGDVTASNNIAQSARALIEQTKASSSTGWEVASVTSLIAEQLRKLPAYMAAQKQAAGVQPTAQTAAQDPATMAAQAAAASASSAAQQVAQQQDSTAVELQALRSTCADLLAEVKELRTSQAAGLASVGNASRRAADALEDALGSDGASFAVTVKG